jgi:glycine dehydrogenase subunit 1
LKYTPHTQKDIDTMLDAIGISSAEALFDIIPGDIRARNFNIADGISEIQAEKELVKTASLNSSGLRYFAGGGFYRHYVPAAVDLLSSRTEFTTAYTPYQAEASQGTLQALYEYQTSICRITSKEAANASLYDGGTALAEAVIMASEINRKNKIIIDSAVNPLYINIIKTYTKHLDLEITEIPFKNYRTDKKLLKKSLTKKTSSVVLQNPNFFGAVSDYEDLIKEIHSAGALAVASVYPLSLGILKTPGRMGFDIVTGEGQSLGNYLNFGGPYLGIMATDKKYMRKLPGRIVGRAEDKDGKRGYLLTLQAREQHIRRQRATSNICTNQNLMALRAQIFLSLLGKDGYSGLAAKNHSRAEELKEKLKKIPGIELPDYGATFNEFVIALPVNACKLIESMLENGIFAGIPLSKFYNGNFITEKNNELLVCATELNDSEDINDYARLMTRLMTRLMKKEVSS